MQSYIILKKTLRSYTQSWKLKNKCHIHSKKVRVQCWFLSSKICYDISDRLGKAKMIPCRNYKVTTGDYVTPPPFRFIIMLILKTPLFLLSHICYYISEKWINTKKRYFAKFVKLLQEFMSTPHPHFVMYSRINKYRLKFVFVVTYMLLHMKQMV